MARLVYIVGESGSGKSTSLRNLDPNSTVIINTDANPLPFKSKGFEIGKNVIITSKLSSIIDNLVLLNKNPKIKVIVIDTFSRIMTDYIMSVEFRNAVDSRAAWGVFAQDIYDLIIAINHHMRNDINVYLLAHSSSVYNDVGVLTQKISVQGKQLEKFIPESFSSIVLYTQVEVTSSGNNYQFRTITNGVDTCKTPIGMFSSKFIENDLKIVDNLIREYYE